MPLGKRGGHPLWGQNKTHFPSTILSATPNMISPHFSEERGLLLEIQTFHKHAFPIPHVKVLVRIRKMVGTTPPHENRGNIF